MITKETRMVIWWLILFCWGITIGHFSNNFLLAILIQPIAFLVGCVFAQMFKFEKKRG